jgi:hypothetical protein
MHLLTVVRGREHFNQGQPACPCGSLINIAAGATPFAHSCQGSSGVHFGTAVRVEMFNLLLWDVACTVKGIGVGVGVLG